MEKANDLVWTPVSREVALDARIFTVEKVRSMAPDSRRTADFSVIDSNEWAMIVPVIKTGAEDEFLMVRQWRHGAQELSLEFPGGVIEKGEDVLAGAKRELEEETGYTAAKWTKLCALSPNPAIMTNKMHFFLAEGLTQTRGLNLDRDEYIKVERHKADKIISEFGSAPLIHCFLASALFFYLRSKN